MKVYTGTITKMVQQIDTGHGVYEIDYLRKILMKIEGNDFSTIEYGALHNWLEKKGVIDAETSAVDDARKQHILGLLDKAERVFSEAQQVARKIRDSYDLYRSGSASLADVITNMVINYDIDVEQAGLIVRDVLDSLDFY